MYRSRIVVLFVVFCSFRLFAQDGSVRPPLSDEERAARRAQREQMLLQDGGGAGGPTSAAVRDQAVTTQRPAEGGQLETTRQATPTGSEVTVNWENITLKDSIEVLCRDLGMEFVISPSVNVSQEVSVRAGDVTRWTAQDKQELFDAILETAGVQKVQRGRVWIFSPSDIRPVVEAFKDAKYGDGKPVIGVIKLKSIDASQAEQFLNTVGGKPQRVFAMKGSRMVLVLGTQQFLTQMEELVKLIDFPAGVIRPYTLQYAASDDLAKELTAIFSGRVGGDGETVRFISVSRLNVVVAQNIPDGMLEDVTKWIELLDRMDDANERSTKVYRLQVINAETISKTLSSLYSTLYKQTQALSKQQQGASAALAKQAKQAAKAEKSGGKEAAPALGNAPAKANGAAASEPKAGGASAKGPGASENSPDMEEEAVILADADTNTLIINATPDQHRDIERTIRELDRPRRQVMIETVLVEVTLDERFDLGVEWAVSRGLAVEGSVEQSSADGFSYLVRSSSQLLAFIQAAENNDHLQVLSSPTVLTRDGMEAEVSFGKEVPIQERTTSTSGNQNNYSYSYLPAKITLTVTPVIDDNKMVTLNLVQSVRQLNANYETIYSLNSVDNPENVQPPIFTTRELRSNLQVENGQTLVLGGLIQREDEKVERGIPYISRIPVIGWLFGWKSTVKKGTEILMVLTPRVIDTRDETDLMTREFRAKILGAMAVDDVRKLYDLEDKKTAEDTPAAIFSPEAEGN